MYYVFIITRYDSSSSLDRFDREFRVYYRKMCQIETFVTVKHTVTNLVRQ